MKIIKNFKNYRGLEAIKPVKFKQGVEKEVLEEAWEFLIRKAHLESLGKLKKIRNIFLDEGDNIFPKQIWFEFSFILPNPFSSFRFACSRIDGDDKYWEKEEFVSKIKKIFDLFQIDNFNKLEKILSLFPLDKYQVSFGFVQSKGKFPARLKIYFWRLSHCCPRQEWIKKINKMCQILGFNNEKISKIAHFSDSDLIGIDFFPSPKNLKNLKIYNHYKKLNRNLISRVFKNNNLKASKNLIDNLLLLNKEKSGSWYLLHRFNQDSELESIKFFKIYEFQKITGMGNLTEELKLFFSKLNKKEKNSWQILKRNFVDKYSFFPSAIGIDFSQNNFRRPYLYLGSKVTYQKCEKVKKIIDLKKALIKIQYQCNNNCLFCHALDKRNIPPLRFHQIINKINQALQIGAEMILFSGGEPTLHPDFPKVVNSLWQRKIPWGLITNGRLLSYRKLSENLLKRNLKYVYLTLNSANPERHDFITRTPGSFNQTLRALKNLSSHQIELIVNVVVTKLNLKDLKKIVDLVEEFKINRIKFSLVEPKGEALKNFNKLIPSLKEASLAINEAMHCAISKKIKTGFDGLSDCLVDNPDLKDNLQTNNILYMSEVFEDRFYRTDEGQRIKGKCCQFCSRKKVCPGIYEGYRRCGGLSDLKPIR